RETESIASMVEIRSSSISTTSSKSFSPSETSIPISRNTLKIRNSCSGSSSSSGKPASTSSGLRNPCSLPLTIRASAASTIGSSVRFSLPPLGAGTLFGARASLTLARALLVGRELRQPVRWSNRCLVFNHALQPGENPLVGGGREADRLQLTGDVRHQVGPGDQ